MSNLKSIYILSLIMIFFVGCSKYSTNTSTAVAKEPTSTEKSVFDKSKVKKEKVVKKKKKKIIKKKSSTYKYCSKHIKAMSHALNYVKEEFEKGYFLQKDMVGAKAQLYLIENKSPSIFAKNINAAQDSYLKQYDLAKKFKCNTKNLKYSPIEKIKIEIEKLEKKATNESK